MAARRKYPWEDWFAAGDVTIIRGLDYDCSQATMVQTIRNNASTRGLYVSVIDLGNVIRIEVLGERDDTARTDQTTVAQ